MTLALVSEPKSFLAEVIPFIRPGARDILDMPIAAPQRVAFCDCGESRAYDPQAPEQFVEFIQQHGTVVIPPLTTGRIL